MKLSLSIEDVKELTGFGRTKIYEAINSGQLPAKKYGKRTIILKDDLLNFLNDLEDYSSHIPNPILPLEG